MSLLLASVFFSGQLSQEKRQPILKEEVGFLRATFFSPKGTITVILPDDITPGSPISGTVFSDIKDFNIGTLQVDIGDAHGEMPNSTSPRRTWVIPKTSEPRIGLTAWTTDGVAWGTTYLSIGPPKTNSSDYVIPFFARIASPFVIKGPLDGDASNTVVKSGEQVLPVVAESLRQTVALIPTISIPGETSMEVIENDLHAKANTRLLKVNISAPKLNLQKGEQTSLTLIVEGISGIDEKKLPMIVVENLTPKAIDLDGKTKHFLFAKPSKEGDFSHTFLAKSLMAGGFSVMATVDPGAGTKVVPGKL